MFFYSFSGASRVFIPQYRGPVNPALAHRDERELSQEEAGQQQLISEFQRRAHDAPEEETLNKNEQLRVPPLLEDHATASTPLPRIRTPLWSLGPRGAP